MYIFQTLLCFRISTLKSMVFFNLKKNEKEDSHIGKHWSNKMCLVIGIPTIGDKHFWNNFAKVLQWTRRTTIKMQYILFSLKNHLCQS